MVFQTLRMIMIDRTWARPIIFLCKIYYCWTWKLWSEISKLYCLFMYFSHPPGLQGCILSRYFIRKPDLSLLRVCCLKVWQPILGISCLLKTYTFWRNLKLLKDLASLQFRTLVNSITAFDYVVAKI